MSLESENRPSQPNPPQQIYMQICDALSSGARPVLLTALSGDGRQIRQLVLSDQTDHASLSAAWAAAHSDVPGFTAGQWAAALANCRAAGVPSEIQQSGAARWVVEEFRPENRLIVFGGGTIAEQLVHLGTQSGFAVTICDDRIGFANRKRFPDADRVICAPFDAIVRDIDLRPSDYVVIVTRGHQYDTACLRRVLPVQPAYFGMIGSRHRVGATRKLLLSEGFTEDQLKRLCSPIGFNIGAITPIEIAISIIAQVICCRRLKQTEPAPTNTKTQRDDADQEPALLECLADPAEAQNPRALLTVLTAKGSTPRGPGARMLVYPDGRTLGSIGGGCAEGEAISLARALLAEGDTRYRILPVDMTGSVAADEGMVCGGVIEVLIQPL